MRRKQKAKRLIKQIAAGDTKAALKDPAQLAVEARLAAGQQVARQLEATGTGDDLPARHTKILHSDMTAAVKKFNSRVTPPPPPDHPIDLGDLADLDEGDKETGGQGDREKDLPSLADLVEDI